MGSSYEKILSVTAYACGTGNVEAEAGGSPLAWGHSGLPNSHGKKRQTVLTKHSEAANIKGNWKIDIFGDIEGQYAYGQRTLERSIRLASQNDIYEGTP